MAQEIKNGNETVVSAVSKTELFFKQYGKAIWAVIAAIVIVGGASYAFYKWSYLPKKAEALAQMYKAENNFNAGAFELALKGDDNTPGFESILADYGTKAGKDIYLYAAICELQIDTVAGNNERALAYLEKYSTSDKLFAARAEALKGDANCNMGSYKKAASLFEGAAGICDSPYNAAYLIKAGLAWEAAGEKGKALEAYKTVKEMYSETLEGRDIDKYITRLECKEE